MMICGINHQNVYEEAENYYQFLSILEDFLGEAFE